MGRRSKARECAMQILYQWDATHEPMDRVCGLFWKVRNGTGPLRAMAERLARGAAGSLPEIDALIEKAITNWRVERVATVDRTILRLGTYELIGERETPSRVVLDEAVELAKRFGEVDSPSFVNGVLDAVMRAVRGAPPPPAPRRRRSRSEE